MPNAVTENDDVTALPFAGSYNPFQPDSSNGEPLGHFFAAVPVTYSTTVYPGSKSDEYVNSAGGWGYDVMEMRLVQDNNTSVQLSPQAAADLFGTLNFSGATLALANSQFYLDGVTTADGLTSLADAFFSRGVWSGGASIPGGGDAAGSYSPGLNDTNNEVTGNAYGNPQALNLGSYGTSTNWNYFYTISTQAYSASYAPDQPVPASAGAVQSIDSPLTGSKLIPMGTIVVSPSGRFELIFQTDGNLVLYDTRVARTAVWASNTAGYGKTLNIDEAGELAISSSGNSNSGNYTIWNSYGDALGLSSGNSLRVSDEGDAFVLHAVAPDDPDNVILWTSILGSTETSTAVSTWVNLDPALDRGDTLGPGQLLTTGEYLLSPNGEFALVMESNSDLMLYDLKGETPRTLWTGIGKGNGGPYSPGGAATAYMNPDGDLSLYSDSDDTPYTKT